MKARLTKMEAEVNLICTEEEAWVIQHVFSYLNAEKWREQYSREIDVRVLDHAIISIRLETERVLRAVAESRKALDKTLRGG